ncbi:MAG: TIGR02757 family protein [Armatimonadota bacterium]
MSLQTIKRQLDRLYRQYNRRRFVPPDPLQALYGYDDVRDREIVGLVASALAYGNVGQIGRSIAAVLERISPPRAFLEQSTHASLRTAFAGFKHRWTTGDEVADLLFGAKRAIERHGSLRACFAAGLREDDETVEGALSHFVRELKGGDDGADCLPRGRKPYSGNAETGLSDAASLSHNSLLPLPERGSACKRLNLFLRWMARRDDVDPGGWNDVGPSRLIVPLDTHMHRLCRCLGLTRRKQADMRTALEVTAAFRTIAPDDPVRYDFALTRLGIHPDADVNAFLRECSVASSRDDA